MNLIHTQTHTTMFAITRFAGLLRTLLSVVLLWPLIAPAQSQLNNSDNSNSPDLNQSILVVQGRIVSELPAFNVRAELSNKGACEPNCFTMNLLINQNTRLLDSKSKPLALDHLKPLRPYAIDWVRGDTQQSNLAAVIKLR